jgi:hypothetical protein
MSAHPLLLFFTVATSIADVISAGGYCDIVTFIQKWVSRSHSCSIFDILHMHKR